jgi:hypothetical protein
MLNILNGLDPRTLSRFQLNVELERLRSAVRIIESEIGMRTKEDTYYWAYLDPNVGWIDLGDDLGKASAKADNAYGDGARHRIQKYYI